MRGNSAAPSGDSDSRNCQFRGLREEDDNIALSSSSNMCGVWLLACPLYTLISVVFGSFCALFYSVFCPLYSIVLCGSRLLFVPLCYFTRCRYRSVNRRLLLLDLSIRSLLLTIPVSMCRLKRLVSWHPCAQRDSNFPLRDVPMVIKLRCYGCHGDAYRGRDFRCVFIYLDGVLVCRLLSSRFSLTSRCLFVISTSTG